MNTQKFTEIIEFLRSLHLRNGGNFIFDDNTILEAATEIYLTEQDKPISNKERVKKEYNKFTKATEKQIHYLSKNNIDHNAENLTKTEAFQLIKEHKEK